MISIILAISDERKQLALKAGFKEETVLVRHEGVMSGKENKARIEGKIMRELEPYQFLVSDYWGAGPD